MDLNTTKDNNSITTTSVDLDPLRPSSPPPPLIESNEKTLTSGENTINSPSTHSLSTSEHLGQDPTSSAHQEAHRSSEQVLNVPSPSIEHNDATKDIDFHTTNVPPLKSDPPLVPEDFPLSYTTNSEGEENLLQFVSNFRRQYVTLFPHRKELLLTFQNEFGIKKFLCATIRPTQVKFKEFYDYRTCARFVADYITYEPLDPPFDLPTTLRSPTRVLTLQRGNAFELSMVLCSFLRGSGFDAFVVSGYATRQITLMDETNIDVDVDKLMDAWEMHAASKSLNFSIDPQVQETAPPKESKYKLKTKNGLVSKYLIYMEEKKKEEKEKNELKRFEALKQQYTYHEETDELAGLRIHAWVLVLPGKRDVSEAFFIEPSTGKVYDLDFSHYLGVESVFSCSNYWVNMQKCVQGLKNISFDLNDTSKWEFLFLQKSNPTYTPKMVVEEEDDDDGDKAATESEKDIVEVGPSWVLPLTITKEQLSSQCPSGSKVLTWRNVKLELFAPYTRDDGLVTRITIFADQLRNIQGAIHERYKHRKDRLWKRVKQPSLGLQNEYFEHGRAHALERHVMKHGKTTELRFYQGARSDGLYLREEKEHKIIEHFEGRPDRLVYRSVTHEVGSEDQVLGIVKMSEHYARRTHEEFGGPGDEVLEVSCNQIYKRSFYIREEKIKVVYHVPFGSLFPGMREFRKPTSDQKSSLLEMTTSFETKPPKKPPKKQHLYARICDLLKAEQTCLSAVKASEREVKEILTTRHSEEKNIQLSVSLFDTIRNTFDITSEMQKESQKQAEEASKEASIDYLSPFLLHYIQEDNTLKLTKEEAMQVKENCLKALKERLIEKSSIIQKRYEEETMSYQKRQQHYSKNSETMSQAETEEYVQFCNDALFRIHVLEKRLAKHKETAPELYLALDKKLAADPRLASLISTN